LHEDSDNFKHMSKQVESYYKYSEKILQSSILFMIKILPDNGGRRSGVDRREFSYTSHIPERRIGKERRSGNDRRLKPRTRKD
jgi:hypothetical protein